MTTTTPASSDSLEYLLSYHRLYLIACLALSYLHYYLVTAANVALATSNRHYQPIRWNCILLAK